MGLKMFDPGVVGEGDPNKESAGVGGGGGGEEFGRRGGAQAGGHKFLDPRV